MHHDHQTVRLGIKLNAIWLVILFGAFSLSVPGSDSWAASDLDQYRANEARVKAIAADPKSIGAKEVAFLAAHSYFHQAVEALSQASVPEARAPLDKIAVEGNQYAARLIVGNLTNRLDALRLLKSESPEVQAIALRGMMGSHGDGPVSLDRAAWGLVKPALSSSNLDTRSAAARVTGLDSGTEVPAVEKAQALIGALRGIESLPEAQQPTGYGVHTFLRGARYEFTCCSIATTLGEVPGLEAEFLRQQTAETTGLVRDCLLLARGQRGDPLVKQELRRLAREHPSPAFRWHAVGMFLKLGTTEDLPWLQEVAERDPFYIEQWLPGTFASPEDEIPRDYYSVRERAREVIQAIRRQATEPPPRLPAEK